MSFYSDASLVMIPSGYKTSKVYSAVPTDGAGDLSFSRSNDTATRVNSAGLIEKVRTNVLTYSQDFSNANWVGFDVTRTGSQTDPNGGTTASLYTSLTSSANVTANFSTASSSPYTLSIYIKGTSSGSVSLRVDSPSLAPSNIINYTTSWQRFTYTFTAGASTSTIVLGGYASFTPSEGIYLAFAQAELGDIATDYIATTSAAVSVGPVANVPRLDYLNSSCPRLLLEPQRTNLVTYSEQIDNAAWPKINATIAANNTTSPDGYVNADKYTKSATGGSVIYQANKSSATANTFSIFAKNDAVSSIRVGMSDNGNTTDYEAIVNLASGTIISTTAGATSEIENYGNGWYRISITRTSLGTVNPFFGIPDAVTGSFFAYGCQLEAGAYATSYIPTLGAAVTRGADVSSKTSISSLIGQSAGTVYFEFNATGAGVNQEILGITLNGGGAEYIAFYNLTNGALYFGSSVTLGILIDANSFGKNFKCAYAYQSGSHVLYVNGSLVSSSTSSTVYSLLNAIYINQNALGTGSGTLKSDQLLLFKTKLTNAQLAELTTI